MSIPRRGMNAAVTATATAAAEAKFSVALCGEGAPCCRTPRLTGSTTHTSTRTPWGAIPPSHETPSAGTRQGKGWTDLFGGGGAADDALRLQWQPPQQPYRPCKNVEGCDPCYAKRPTRRTKLTATQADCRHRRGKGQVVAARFHLCFQKIPRSVRLTELHCPNSCRHQSCHHSRPRPWPRVASAPSAPP